MAAICGHQVSCASQNGNFYCHGGNLHQSCPCWSRIRACMAKTTATAAIYDHQVVAACESRSEAEPGYPTSTGSVRAVRRDEEQARAHNSEWTEVAQRSCVGWGACPAVLSRRSPSRRRTKAEVVQRFAQSAFAPGVARCLRRDSLRAALRCARRLVLGGGLEPPRLSAYAPQTYVSAIPPPEQR